MINTNDPGIRPTVKYVEGHLKETPLIGLVLGSGLGSFADQVEDPVILSTEDIPGYPHSTVPGHAGNLVAGRIGDVPVIVVQGRVHYYEGYPLHKVVVPTRLLAALGVRGQILTNAAGAISDELTPGDLMAISDHINLFGNNPLIGQNWGFDRFPDMSRAYDPDLRALLHESAEELGIQLRVGVLGGFMGPTYETAAEVNFLRSIGAHAACMSTVPEAIAASRLRLPNIGISAITNYATGMTGDPLSHEEVTVMGKKVEQKFAGLLLKAVPKVARELEQNPRYQLRYNGPEGD